MKEPKAPKLDPKMFVMLIVFYFSRKIDMKDMEIVDILRTVFVSVSALILALYSYVYTRVTSNKSKNAIWVPPPAKPQLPFNLGPPAEPLKHGDFTKTTYEAHEMEILKKDAMQIVTSLGFTLLMSYKFNIHMSLLMQTVMTPLNLLESKLLKKYLLGSTIDYEELDHAPTDEDLAKINANLLGTEEEAAEVDSAKPKLVPVPESNAFDKNEPRVEEIKD